MEPRWKGKGAKARALADPMSEILSQLKYSLIQSNSTGLLSGCSVLLEAGVEQTDLLNRACFGRPIVTMEKNAQWFQLGLEEAYYLCHSLKCIRIKGEDFCLKSVDELWICMKSMCDIFPYLYKAYSHLRIKNWVVRSGCQYGVDYVAYRHHPSLVHSEYAVLVFLDQNEGVNGRLRVWSDFYCTIRLCGSVAKTLLAIKIKENSHNALSSFYLESCTLEEFSIQRWNPELCRED